MISLSLGQLAEVVGGELCDAHDAQRLVDTVTIDSRTAGPGSLFVPVTGERADGHDFIADAAARNAAGYLVAAGRPLPGLPGGVIVDDPANALLGLGTWVRETVDPTVVAVTGSNGKTTTKDLIAATVGAGRPTVASHGSYNNELGVPLTLCRLTRASEVLVAEIGARGVGQIARLIPVVQPDLAVVTTVSGAHLAQFKTLEVVRAAKAELVEGLPPGGLAVLNADDPRVAAMARTAQCRVVTYGRFARADWQAEDVQLDTCARAHFRIRGLWATLPLPGEHNVGNALAALAVADACGVPLVQAVDALAHASVSRWRMEMVRTTGGIIVLNDAYNANPASTEAALRALAQMAVDGRRWAVLGRMAELGSSTAAAHERIGRLVTALGLDALVVVADPIEPEVAPILAGAGAGELVTCPDEAVALLRSRLCPGDAVLVKASRSVGLEQVATALLAGGAGRG
jgi:UDP-N-acetylmuramoyl-tripeptide--D-alanyl-D-alanine ligase